MGDLPPIERRVLIFFGREQAYWTANGALLAFSAAMLGFGFAPVLLPLVDWTLIAVEVAIGTFAAMGFIGILLHMGNNRSWWARWAYLFVCFSSALTIVAFLLASILPLDPVRSLGLSPIGALVVFLLLLTGSLIGISMHVEYGGRGDTVRRKVMGSEPVENDD